MGTYRFGSRQGRHFCSTGRDILAISDRSALDHGRLDIKTAMARQRYFDDSCLSLLRVEDHTRQRVSASLVYR